MENYIAQFVKQIKDSNKTENVEIGVVVSPLPDLAVQVGELQVDKDDFYITEGLPNALKSGDRVAVMPIRGGQKYIILSKVVGL